jgi:hypothetical protein
MTFSFCVYTMPVDIQNKIRAYLRENLQTNMRQYHLVWTNGQTRIASWDYQNVPAPDNATLTSVALHFFEYETDTFYTITIDIYSGRIANSDVPDGMAWVTCALAAARQPNISTRVTTGAITDQQLAGMMVSNQLHFAFSF